MRYLLDTNCCIYLFSSLYPQLVRRVSETEQGDIALSSITYAELVLGSNLGKPPDPTALRLLVTQMPVMPFDDVAAGVYGRLPFRRGSFDRLIAAHAMALDLIFVTHNVADFADIAGLKIEDWTQ